ncbi:MAG: hypothetical protein WBL92_01230 [Methanothrix sp.]|nr:hypothetical protein [Methanothrix sp.]MDD1733476.1 hypothetical protein [Methanothrix sp.]MDD1738700.1 hypothetical protein [Methanothrix sp.]OYV11994.1 MAG: hypothetical protein CG445_796 [Methanosaeta sp. ASM2]OYV14088.1 MAG: hypothetical protein CG440_837 [Methanosaeta sp. NSM2]
MIVLMAVAYIAFPAALGYDATQQAMINGTTLSWKMATAYAAQDIPTFNSLADQWNVWVRQYFGEDPNLLMKKMTGPVDLTKPYLLANNSSRGIVHKIDGMNQMNTSYTTNDVNLLPKGVDPTKLKAVNPWQQGGAEYLGGV